jgi:hypothetical protein
MEELMTLRDNFASAILGGILACSYKTMDMRDEQVTATCEMAYLIADEMIKARSVDFYRG